MKKTIFAALLAAAAFTVPATSSAGIVWSESGGAGAGELLGTAQIISNGQYDTLDAITGNLFSSVPLNGSPRYQVDLFQIRIDDVTTFSARTVGSDFDTELFLFDSNGFGVYANDDDVASIDSSSLLPAGHANGPASANLYYLAVAFGGFIANDVFDNPVFQAGGFTDVLGPNPGAGSLASWVEGFSAASEVPVGYRIELTGVTTGERPAQVPEPASTALALTAVLGAWAARRRARRTSMQQGAHSSAAVLSLEVTHHA
ncbi:MAG: hypothetical protein EOP35_11700 [Rubrivivax sp.]|nr:MAG: hypothetical protein EOP35_11700 [Rubrivivax sp.]